MNLNNFYDKDFRQKLLNTNNAKSIATLLGYDSIDDSVEFEVVTNTESITYFTVPALPDSAELVDVSDIQAAATSGTAGTAATAGSVGTVCTCIGSAGSASSVSSLGSQ